MKYQGEGKKMGYSTRQEVYLALANALSQGGPVGDGQLVPITTIGNSLSSAVTPEQISQYVRWADEQINAALTSLYRVPLSRVNFGTYYLAVDVTAGDTQLVMNDSTMFVAGDVVLIRNDTTTQELIIASIPDDHTMMLIGPVVNSYSAVNSDVERIRYPDPIPMISARLAAATLYDKHFAAQVTGNETEYGKKLRAMAFDTLNQILSGVVKLYLADASDYVGRRYYNHALDDSIGSKVEPKQFFKTE
jgi:hypothetical protein